MSWKKVAYLDEVATLSDVAPQDVKVQTADKGVGTAASRDDHKHNVAVDVPVAITEGASQAEGTSTSLARADHEHGSPVEWSPSAHAADHKSGGGDEILLHELGPPTAAIEINKQSFVSPVIDPQATAPATPVDGQIYYNTADDHLHCYVAA